MKRSLIVILFCVAGLVFQACHKTVLEDESSSDATSSAVITLSISTTQTQTKAVVDENVLGEAEYAIKTIRIYAFNSDEAETDPWETVEDGSLDVMELITFSTPLVSGSAYHQIDLRKDASKRLYVIVNEPSDLTATLDEITTMDALDNIDYTIAEAMNSGFVADATFSVDDFLIPMTAVDTIDATGSKSISIGVDRAVARVDLMLDKDDAATDRVVELTSATTFTVDGTTYTSRLFVGDLSTPAEEDLKGFTVNSSTIKIPLEEDYNSTSQRVLSFYIAERKYSLENAISIVVNQLHVNGVTIELTSTITMEGADLTTIDRNTVYRIYATYKGEQEAIVADNFTIVDWEEEQVDADMSGVLVAVEPLTAMDWLRNGNSYTAANISFGSNKPIEILLPIVTGKDEDGIATYDFVEYEFDDMTSGASYDLMSLDLGDGENYIAQTSWITGATLTFTSAQTGYITYTYSPLAINYKLQTYPVRIQSENVIKQMLAVYDNGYIPNRLLDDDWAERAPYGSVFAKRGDDGSGNLHPTITEDIFYRDDDGYYRGEVAMTAEAAQTYCQTTLGPNWYLPSKDDMHDILRGVTELGVSYRFNTTGSELDQDPSAALYWTSTADDDNDGYYWAGDFIRRTTTIPDEENAYMSSENGEQLLFVRCALDL